MVIILFRLLILIAVILLSYTVYCYMADPARKLEQAKSIKKFYLLDDKENSKRNILFTYKGILFEGEKYVGALEDSFAVITINVYARNPEELAGFEREDLYFLEKELLIRYPYAEVEWKHPISQLVLSKN